MVDIDIFPALANIPNLTHGFIPRIKNIDVQVEREEALHRLKSSHDAILQQYHCKYLCLAEQVHSNKIAYVTNQNALLPVSGADGLYTDVPGITLGIYVADCAAVFIADPVKNLIALVHSGKKGTELGIVPTTIETLKRTHKSTPEDLIIQIAPCIRPPLYETDFAAEIIRQSQSCGVRNIFDSGVCTGANTNRYYSYRIEKGKTGRMLAFLSLRKPID